MKKLKKALSLTLALALALALAVPALAVELKTGDDGSAAIKTLEVNVTADSVGAVTTYKYQPDADSDFVVEVPVYDIMAYEVVKFTGPADFMLFLGSINVTAADGTLTQTSDWVYDSSEGAEGEYIWYMFDSGDPEGMMTLFALRLEALAGVKYVGLRLNNQAAAPAETEQPADPSAVTTVEVAASNNQRLNVRSGPGTNYKIAAPALKNGTVLQISEISGQWGKLADGKGWVYLPATRTISKPAAPAETEQPAAPAETEQPAAPAETEQPAAPAGAGSYTARKGDTWSSICINFYGSNAQRYNLMNANKGVALKDGAVITLPAKLGKDALIPAPAAGEGEKLYTVVRGDTLGKIAAAEYGKVSEYKAIFERNADRLKNADSIYEGQVIVLPAKK